MIADCQTVRIASFDNVIKPWKLTVKCSQIGLFLKLFAMVISPGGEIIGRFDKMFPFLPFESGVEGCIEFLISNVPNVGRFGVSICYDIWFPETTPTLTSAGVEVLIHPVLTGTTDRRAELAIVQATTALFQCYVLDVNGLDADGVGRSIVADPAGNVVYEAGEGPAIFPIMLDLGLVRQARATGANGLGQVLKSCRDRSVDFPVEAEMPQPAIWQHWAPSTNFAVT